MEQTAPATLAEMKEKYMSREYYSIVLIILFFLSLISNDTEIDENESKVVFLYTKQATQEYALYLERFWSRFSSPAEIEWI